MFNDVFPCTGASYEFTVNYRTAVEHTVALVSESETGTFVEVATFVAVPVEPSLPTYRGHFAAHGRLSIAAGTSTTDVTFTESVDASGSDGSAIRFHDNTHATFTESGDMISGFDKAFCK